jgi:hypothetical protein
MSPKEPIKSQCPDEKPFMAPAQSVVPTTALKAPGMSSRVSRGLDVGPEHLHPKPVDLEVRYIKLNSGGMKGLSSGI